jgi:hypothetical protein
MEQKSKFSISFNIYTNSWNMTETESGDLLMTSQDRRGPDYWRRNSQIYVYESLREIKKGIEKSPLPKGSGYTLGYFTNNSEKNMDFVKINLQSLIRLISSSKSNIPETNWKAQRIQSTISDLHWPLLRTEEIILYDAVYWK